MGSVANTKALKDFEELLSAAWAAQLAKLRAQPNSDDKDARGGASGKAEVGLSRHEAQSGEGEDGHD